MIIAAMKQLFEFIPRDHAGHGLAVAPGEGLTLTLAFAGALHTVSLAQFLLVPDGDGNASLVWSTGPTQIIIGLRGVIVRGTQFCDYPMVDGRSCGERAVVVEPARCARHAEGSL